MAMKQKLDQEKNNVMTPSNGLNSNGPSRL